MNLARKMLKLSGHNKYRIISILVKGSRVINVGVNKDSAPKRFTRPHRPGMKLHSEVSAILGIDKKVSKGATIVINGETVAENPINTKPCPTCYNILKEMKIKRIVFSNKGKIEEIKL